VRWFVFGWGLFVAFLGTQRKTRIRIVGLRRSRRLLTWPMRIAVIAFGLAVAMAAFLGWF
jgi:hypothetical protein